MGEEKRQIHSDVFSERMPPEERTFRMIDMLGIPDSEVEKSMSPEEFARYKELKDKLKKEAHP